MQAVSILQKLVARAEAELSFLALWPQASTHHISQGRRERKSKKSGLVWPMLELVSAESACCLQMRINLSYCLSGTQSTPATLLFSIDHIYGACEPMIDGRMKSTKDLLQASDNFWQRTDFVWALIIEDRAPISIFSWQVMRHSELFLQPVQHMVSDILILRDQCKAEESASIP